jgi:hypothetical protein
MFFYYFLVCTFFCLFIYGKTKTKRNETMIFFLCFDFLANQINFFLKK